jgi:hypothetical protein
VITLEEIWQQPGKLPHSYDGQKNHQIADAGDELSYA